MTCFDPVLWFAIYLLLQTMPMLGPFVTDSKKPGPDCLEECQWIGIRVNLFVLL